MAASESDTTDKRTGTKFAILAFMLAIGLGLGGQAFLAWLFGREFVERNPSQAVALILGVPTALGCVLSLVPIRLVRTLTFLLAVVVWLAGLGIVVIYWRNGIREAAVVWASGAAITAIIYIPAELWESRHAKTKDESLSIPSLIFWAFFIWPICAVTAFCVFADAVFGIDSSDSDEAGTEATDS